MTDVETLRKARNAISDALGYDRWKEKPLFSSIGAAGIGKEGQLLVQVTPEANLPPACHEDLTRLLSETGFGDVRIEYYQTELDIPDED